MAECSASGTALDRAIRQTVSTSIQQATGQSLQSIAEKNGAMLMASSAMMPLQAPQTLTLPATARNHHPVARNAAVVGDGNALSLMDRNKVVGSMPMHVSDGMPVQYSQFHAQHQDVPNPMVLQQQMQMQMWTQQQQQNMQMQAQMQMQQQMQAMSLYQAQQQQAINQQQQEGDSIHQEPLHRQDSEVAQNNNVKQDNGVKQKEDWYDGLEDEWERLAEQQGHEGLTEGASIDQLASAWADAEATWAEEEEKEAMKYEFREESRNVESANAMEEGMKLFNKGETNRAITFFEAELLERPGNSDAWKMLGKCHAENDEDRRAIACLERAVEADPYSLEALLSLGVSYVNELNNEKALNNLKAWVQNNIKYADLQVVDDGYGSGTVLDDVQSLLLQALKMHPRDADVLEALGVCYNASREYDSAIECLRSAIEVRPNDYQLWNKLGATLANCQKSDEALPAYNRALDLKPKYARAWLNMAISHSNLQNYDDAARCYLQTLSLSPEALHCWSYLRIALSCSEKWDLLPLVGAQDVLAFREHFDFVPQL